MTPQANNGATYHTLCTGDASKTVNRRNVAKDDQYGESLTLYGACFCPFVHRVWIALELLDKVPYKYVEIDPYKKPKELLEINAKGLVPALKIGESGKCLGESTVMLEYLEDRYKESGLHTLLPPSDAYTRARQRLACDKVNRTLIPSFYRYLQAQEPEKQVTFGKEFVDELKAYEDGMLKETSGVFWDGTNRLGYVDVMLVPWLWRAKIVLGAYRGLDLDTVFDRQGRFARYLKALFEHPAFKATTSTEDLYVDSYARYAENRPFTSQVADAINSGRGLP